MEWRSERLLSEATYGYVCVTQPVGGSTRILSEPSDDPSKNIAIVGAGPRGLLAAFYLFHTLTEGYHIRIFEQNSCKEAFQREYIFSLPRDTKLQKGVNNFIVNVLLKELENIIDVEHGNTFLCGDFQRVLARFLFRNGIKIDYDTSIKNKTELTLKKYSYYNTVSKNIKKGIRTYVLIRRVNGETELSCDKNNNFFQTELEKKGIKNDMLNPFSEIRVYDKNGKQRKECFANGVSNETWNALKEHFDLDESETYLQLTEKDSSGEMILANENQPWTISSSIAPLLDEIIRKDYHNSNSDKKLSEFNSSREDEYNELHQDDTIIKGNPGRTKPVVKNLIKLKNTIDSLTPTPPPTTEPSTPSSTTPTTHTPPSEETYKTPSVSTLAKIWEERQTQF